MHFNTQAYTYETSWSSTKSRKIELQSYLMYIKDYLKKHKSYAHTYTYANCIGKLNCITNTNVIFIKCDVTQRYTNQDVYCILVGRRIHTRQDGHQRKVGKLNCRVI